MSWRSLRAKYVYRLMHWAWRSGEMSLLRRRNYTGNCIYITTGSGRGTREDKLRYYERGQMGFRGEIGCGETYHFMEMSAAESKNMLSSVWEPRDGGNAWWCIVTPCATDTHRKCWLQPHTNSAHDQTGSMLSRACFLWKLCPGCAAHGMTCWFQLWSTACSSEV